MTTMVRRVLMSKATTHFCDYCQNEVWGEEVICYAGHEFCSDACVENYSLEEAGF